MHWAPGMLSGYTPHPQEDVEDDEDFYGAAQASDGNGEADATAGAQMEDSETASARAINSTSNSPAIHVSAEEKKRQQEESQKHLDDLRARLLAKKASGSRAATPAKTTINSKPPPAQPPPETQHSEVQQTADVPSSDEYGLDALLAEGKAAAEAETARKNEQATAANSPMQQQTQQKDIPNTGITGMITEKADIKPVMTPARPVQEPQQQIQKREPGDSRNTKPVPNSHSTLPPMNLSDPYYDDLPVWLEFTGYHDQPFRDSKLGTYKQRKKLEQEAVRIAQELEKLRQAETNDLASLRASSAHPSGPPAMAPPPLPSMMPSGEARATTNGTKRPHSPDPPASDKAVRRNGDAGFRIRGADEASGVVPRRNGSPLERRLSFPERRRSLDDRERDPSLERRQRHYRHDDDGPGASTRHDTFTPSREPPRFNRGEREREREPRASFSSVNAPGGYRDGGRQYRGSSGLDLRKGGVRYFMIKSWNHENVLQAMKDDVWATQEKNEQLLAEAFRTSRHVILLFSVNKSMKFQGYALMTSPPSPAIRKPAFCEKLNWGTSSAFTLRWLATTPVHFRMVGHLKNTCNPDEDGQPRAVLVGKDGQEISQDAGMGTVWILDAVEEEEVGRLMGGYGGK